MKIASSVRDELSKLANREKRTVFKRFFKTGKGEYGEGDEFLGVTVPQQRSVAQRFFKSAGFADLQELLGSKVHEHRFTALEMLVMRYEHCTDDEGRKVCVDFYLTSARRINNWDLVDTSAPYILGEWLSETNAAPLRRLARSKNLWERRIAIVATYAFIRRGRCEDTIAIATMLLNDTCDLIHKAVGWMLREVGKRDVGMLIRFLDKHAKSMPRTMLRYAIERLPAEERTYFLGLGR